MLRKYVLTAATKLNTAFLIGFICADDPLMSARHKLKPLKQALAVAIFICDKFVFSWLSISRVIFLAALSVIQNRVSHSLDCCFDPATPVTSIIYFWHSPAADLCLQSSQKILLASVQLHLWRE